MVSKLRFKGSKKRRHHSTNHHGEKKQRVGGNKAEIKFHINNKLQSADQIDPKIFTKCNWTSATTITDLKEGMPIVMGVARKGIVDNNKIGVISVAHDKLNITIAKESDLKITAKGDSINFLPQMNLESPIYRVEPENIAQIFTVVRVDSILSTKHKVDIPDAEKTYVYIALKSPKTKKFLSHNSEKHTLCMSSTLTAQEIFKFILKPTDTSNFQISMETDGSEDGKSNESYKLIVTDKLKPRLICDPDDLLDDLNQFNIRVQIANCSYAESLIDEINKLQTTQPDQEDAVDESIRLALRELQKSGIKITDKIYYQLKEADKEGKLHEFLLDLKEKYLTDRRA